MEHVTFYAVGPNCYGIGKTMAEAIALAKQNWPSLASPRRPQPKHFSVWVTDAPEISRVDPISGGFSVAKGYSTEKIQTSVLAEKVKA